MTPPALNCLPQVDSVSTAESISARVEVTRIEATRGLNQETRSQLGQFLTPWSVSAFMASMFESAGSAVRILDAGCGVGSLFSSAAVDLASRPQGPKTISIAAFDVDPLLVRVASQTMTELRAARFGGGVRIDGIVHHTDFLDYACSATEGGLFGGPVERFTHAILNPPYKKIDAQSPIARRLKQQGHTAANLYAAFVSLAVELLEPNGELVAIIPRSFCNGLYFRDFRKSLLDRVEIVRVHLFEHRDTEFAGDDVLQENIIIHLRRRPCAVSRDVVVSGSESPDDDMYRWRRVPRSSFIDEGLEDHFWRVAVDANDDQIAAVVSGQPCSLAQLGVSVSTGRVVDFRVRRNLRDAIAKGCVPLLYPTHITDRRVVWPRSNRKKPAALMVDGETAGMLQPRGTYVLLKRFSSKEEARRVVASLLLDSDIEADHVAVENHLNVFHIKGGGLDSGLAKGLWLYLNSTLVDLYFRSISGHTQVNATDIRALRFPLTQKLAEIGQECPDTFPGQAACDEIIGKHLDTLGAGMTLDPVLVKARLQEAQQVLVALGFSAAQTNERSALTLLALLDLPPGRPWSQSSRPLLGITQMMEVFRRDYGKDYAANTRETVRRQTVHQFVDAGLVVQNPDDPSRPTNSGKNVYQIAEPAIDLLQKYGTADWEKELKRYRLKSGPLAEAYAKARSLNRISVQIPDGVAMSLSPGGQNPLIKQIIEEFCSRFTPGAKVLYVGETDAKWGYFDKPACDAIGIEIDAHGKMPDVVIYDEGRDWLVLIEAVTSHGPVNPKRLFDLKTIFANATPGLVFVTAFEDRRTMSRYLGDIAWETEVWIADAPDHLIHFNGERFLGPYEQKANEPE